MRNQEGLMGRLQNQLPAMFALAHDHSEGARVELAGKLADLFLAHEAGLTLREQELVNELIDHLVQLRSPAVRAQLVQRFADAARMPRKIALSLVGDSIDVARKVLIDCQTLTDEDLVDVVHMHGRDHADAIARRASISEAVADALVTTGDIKVMQLVAENLGAQLSQKAVDVLVDAARFASTLREPVMKRPELTAEAAARLYWWVSQDLRRYSLKRFGLTSGQTDEALAKAIDAILGYYDLEKANDTMMAQVADWLAERKSITPRILPQVLRLGHFRLFNILLGRMAGLDAPSVDAVVGETGGRWLAVVCRALGVDKPGFVSLFLLSRGARPGEQIVHPRELSYALAAYDRLTTNLARDLLTSWKRDPSYLLKPHDDIALEA